MRRTDQVVGLARSLAIYHLVPGRQRRLRRLYSRWVAPGDLVFDIGAHVGNRTRAFVALGCRVVAVEPQPQVAALLRRLIGRRPEVTIVEAAVAATPGRVRLAVSDRTPTVSTITDPWRQARGRESGFAGVAWNRAIEVEAVTLDDLVTRFGTPAFVKLDIEGGEPAALDGLTTALPAVSFECLGSALDAVDRCARRLAALGRYRFNWSAGESGRLAAETWMDGGALVAALTAARLEHGDVYALREPA